MLRRIAVVIAVAGCAAPPPPPAAPAAAPMPFAIADATLGPLTADTPANLTALRELLGPRGFTVTPVNDSGVELHVFDGSEKLFYVIPNDDGTLFNVHVVSGAIPIRSHPTWVIGQPLASSAELTYCDCWGPSPMCWKDGDHVAIGFARDCSNLGSAAQREVLVGVPIQRAVWSPRPFGGKGDADIEVAEPPSWVPHENAP